jgi:DNA polymerase sigma
LEDVEVDISLNDTRGTAAAGFLKQQQELFEALKPMTLILKAFLKVLYLACASRLGLNFV